MIELLRRSVIQFERLGSACDSDLAVPLDPFRFGLGPYLVDRLARYLLVLHTGDALISVVDVDKPIADEIAVIIEDGLKENECVDHALEEPLKFLFALPQCVFHRLTH